MTFDAIRSLMAIEYVLAKKFGYKKDISLEALREELLNYSFFDGASLQNRINVARNTGLLSVDRCLGKYSFLHLEKGFDYTTVVTALSQVELRNELILDFIAVNEDCTFPAVFEHCRGYAAFNGLTDVRKAIYGRSQALVHAGALSKSAKCNKTGKYRVINRAYQRTAKTLPERPVISRNPKSIWECINTAWAPVAVAV